MTKEEITEKAQELTIKNVTDGKNKYFSCGFYKGCVVGLEYNNEYLLLQNTELEKENAELKKEIEELKKTYRKQRNKRIDELQKANAELKLKLDVLEGQTPWKDIKDKSEVIGQLSTAKELLKWWVSHCGDHDLFYAEKTERFLSEVEK